MDEKFEEFYDWLVSNKSDFAYTTEEANAYWTAAREFDKRFPNG